MTSKTQASSPTHAITQHPLLLLDRDVRHGGCSGKCESFTMPCNVERGLPNCITVPICLGGVFHVTLGVMELQHVAPHQEQRCLSTSMCWTQYETICRLYGFKSQILLCHIFPAYIQVRTRSDQTLALTSNYCVTLLFVNLYNTHTAM